MSNKTNRESVRRLPRGGSHPVFTVRFTEGLATRHRLPLDHVIRVLTEIKNLIEEVGRRLQRERGVEKITGDFGLELQAGFRRGSVQANILITRNIETGIDAATHVIATVKQLRPGTKRRSAPAIADLDPRVLARLNNTSKVLEIDRTAMKLQLAGPQRHKVEAVFDESAAELVARYQEASFELEHITLYGRLRELRDPSSEDEEGKYFFGELVRDGDEVWRIRFRTADKERAAALWSKQIYVIGQALYYRAASPKILVEEFGADEPRDYEAAFDELYGLNADLYNADLQALLTELRGG